MSPLPFVMVHSSIECSMLYIHALVLCLDSLAPTQIRTMWRGLRWLFVSHKDRGLFKDPVLFLEKKAFSLPEGSSAEWLWPFWRCQSEFFYLAWVYHIRVVQNGNRKCWLATYWKEKIVGRWPECKQVFIAQKEVCLSACLDTIKSHSTQFPIRQTDTACYKYASDLAVNQ